MSEISSIPKVAPDLPHKAVEAAGQEALHPIANPVQAVSPKEPVSPEKTHSKEPVQPEKARSELPLKDMDDVRLKYQVNPETKELTVLIIDRATREVIRTIPQEELKNFKKGGLLELAS